MNGVIFCILLAVCSIVTALITEGEKQLIADFSKNLLAFITGIIVGALVGVLYYFFNELSYTNTNIVYLVLLAASSGLGAMLGYDKVSQTIEQIQESFTTGTTGDED